MGCVKCGPNKIAQVNNQKMRRKMKTQEQKKLRRRVLEETLMAKVKAAKNRVPSQISTCL